MNASGTVTRCQPVAAAVSVALSAAAILLSFFILCVFAEHFLLLLPLLLLFCAPARKRTVTLEYVCVCVSVCVRDRVWMFAGGRVVGCAMTPRPPQIVE